MLNSSLDKLQEAYVDSIDENELIELPPDENPVDHRKYYPYGP